MPTHKRYSAARAGERAQQHVQPSVGHVGCTPSRSRILAAKAVQRDCEGGPKMVTSALPQIQRLSCD